MLQKPSASLCALTVKDYVIAACLIAFAALFLLLHIKRDSIPMEDAFMLLRYSKNLAEGHGIVWNVGEHPVEGATDFLYMAVLGVIGRVTHASVIAVGHAVIFVSQILTVATLYLASRKLFNAPVLIAVVFAVLCACGTAYHFVDTLFSAPFFGFFALLAWVAAYFMVEAGITQQRAFVFSLLGLIVGLIRPEGNFLAVFMLLAALYGVKEHRLKLLLTFIGTFALLGGTYFLWRWHYFGYVLPNPFYTKHDLSFDATKITARIVTELTLPALPLLGLGLIDKRGRRALAMIFGILVLFTLMWSFMSQDNNGYNRFQYVVIALVYLSAADTTTSFYRETEDQLKQKPGLRYGLAGFCAVGAFVGIFYVLHLDRYYVVNPGGHDLGMRLQPLAANHDTMVTTEAGALPFYSEWRTIDAFGLNDAYIAHHRGEIPAEYLDRYKPEMILYKAQQFGPVALTPAEVEEDRRHFGSRQPLIATELRNYAVSHGYTLAAIYGAHSCDYHYIWVKTDSPDAPAILSAVQDYPYRWQYGGQATFNFKDSDGAAIDNCTR